MYDLIFRLSTGKIHYRPNAMKAYGGVVVLLQSFLTSVLGGGESRLLYLQGENPQYPYNRRLGAPDSRSGQFGGEAFLLLLPGIKPRSSVVQPLA
jgi:hypothetical protein